MSPAPILNPTARLTDSAKVPNSTVQQNGTGSPRNETSLSPLQPTPHANVNAKDAAAYVTLTITRQATTYITIIQLGDSFPTTFPNSNLQPTSPPKTTVQHPGIPTGDIVGIIVGCIVGFGLLVGVFYVYLLRARQFRRAESRKRSRRGSTSTGMSRSTQGGPPPPPPGMGGPPPPHPGPPPPPGGMPFPPPN
jgi:hypothetical protein